jgi:hypothetical protein
MKRKISNSAMKFMIERHTAGDNFEDIARKMRKRRFAIANDPKFKGESVRKILTKEGVHTPKKIGVGTPEDRFRAQVEFDEHGCLIWTGHVDAKGYGTMGDGALAHRFSWQLAHGQLEPGVVLHHVCRDRRCVNPAHLLPVPTVALHSILHVLENELSAVHPQRLADLLWVFSDEDPPSMPNRTGALPVPVAG